MRGERWLGTHDGHYVTPSIYLVDQWNKNSIYQQTEIFGPNVSIYRVKDLEEALEINNASGFGLAMSLFTKNKELYEKALVEAKVGLLNWNRTTNGASSCLPFGGLGKSGNDRPSAHYAVWYTTSPVASMEDHNSFNKEQILPGITF